jgi:photosystem II stability/assembly factor-like uncharacterized protein
MTITAPARTPVTDAAAQALFEEARRRRRHRRSWFVVGVVLSLAVAVVALLIGKGTPGGPPTSASHQGKGLNAAPAQPRPGDQAAANASFSPVQKIGLADDEVGWAAAGYSVYVTTDQGRTWRSATPPYFQGRSAIELAGTMTAIGRQDLWLPVGDLIGPPPPVQPDGSIRVSGIEHSTDGGVTWTFTGLPGCLQECGDEPSVSFLNAEDGFASIGPDQTGGTKLFSTNDGGTTWTPVAEMPFGGDDPSIVFSTSEDGWAITGPTYGTYAENEGQMTNPGGLVFRTRDGGLTWSRSLGLPSHIVFQLPSFSNASDGVVLGETTSTSFFGTSVPLVYATNDGGSTWTAHRVPAALKVSTPSSGVWIAAAAPFAAVSPSDWKLYIGPALYRTNDAGRTWVRSVLTPKLGVGSVYSIAFSSPNDGIAMVQQPGCPTPKSGDCDTVLTGTDDGGLHWHPLKLPE